YSGDPRTCRSFLSKCSLIFELQPSSFQSERSKVAYIVSLMSGRAGTWATAVWEQQTPICSSLAAFMAEIKKVFESPLSGREAARKLLRLRQGSLSVSDYAVDFRTLAADSSWNSDSLFNAFLNGLSDDYLSTLS
uniref:Retrotransposon gag domain-containing protein n=1 Tax=Gasterosteus aculeatus TaxID=69293 RepID=G3NES4_GASAC